MSNETEAPTRKPLKLSSPGKLELKKTVDGGQVRQSFPHGRTKTVTVELKKKRTYTQGAGGKMTEVPHEAEAKLGLTTPPPPVVEIDDRPHHTLTEHERVARTKALEQARRDEDVRKQFEEEEAKRAAERTEREKAEIDKRRREEDERKAAEEATKVQRETQAQAAAVTAARAEKTTDASGHAHVGKMHLNKAIAKQATEEAEDAPRRRVAGPGHRPVVAPKPAPTRTREDQRRRGAKLTVVQALDSETSERMRSVAAFRRRTEKEKRALMAEQPQLKIVRDVTVPEAITVQELANRMAERGADVIKTLMKMGVMATINQTIDADTAELVISEFGHRMRRVAAADVEVGVEGAADDSPEHMVSRPPVITIMGHVDHGKTSLLDAIRQTDVAAHEAGGITQHIGAYQVTVPSGKKITFIDTPGHAAFTEMRARGANVTDIVVLVVAGDDGIMPQTIEAIRHAKAANVPILVAINKMDKPDANAQKVRQELLNHELVTEDLGGDILTVEVSAKTKMNLDKLEETLLLQAEVLDLKANPDRAAQGAVIEAKLERGRGTVATLLVQKGTLRVGDIFVAGTEWGRVRALLDDKGKAIDAAGPAMPVEVLGLQGTPQAGDVFSVVETEARAREVTEFRQHTLRQKTAAAGARGTLEEMFSKIATGEARELPVVIKADVQGSVEAIVNSLKNLSTDEVAAKILHSGVGGINEADVTLARASGGLIIGFNVRANPQARELAKRDQVDIRYYSIIYNVVDDVKAALSGMLKPTLRERFLGNAEIREVFQITKSGKVAGCMVTEGQVKRGAKVRLLRDNVVIHEGSLKTLKRFKDEVREVKEGFECGMAFENYENILKGDIIECFEMEEVARTLA
jgi:translation initiation factor IF-2